MKKIVILVIFLLSVSVGCNIKMDNLNPDELSIRQLQEDFLYIRDQIENNHPALYLYYPQEIFNGFFDEAYASIDKPMTEAQFFRLLAPLVSKVKCCHTFIDFSDSYKEQERKAKLFPLGVTFLNGKAYIYQNYSHRTNITLGTRIISINGVPISTILMKLSDGISADGNITTSKYRKINRLFFQLYYELIDTPDYFEIRCLTPNETSEFTISIEALPYDQVWGAFQALNQNRGPLNLSIYENSSTAILKVSSFATNVQPDFKTFMRSSFQDIIQHNIQNLVIDLRGNSGGTPEYSADLLSYLIDYPFVYFSEGIEAGYPSLFIPKTPYDLNFNGNVYFLINGACVSSAGHFCSLAQYHKLGLFIGEETGGSFYCNDNHINTTLPHSKIKLQVARTTWATAVSGFEKGKGIMPDYSITQSLDDRIHNIDRELIYVLQLIEGK
ncbi:MAG TPA: S41 family peptidase [Candidatus Deferrimicrobium sp.]|nr:S41 family peptidase [Candidatus Kapabacteria bacterium]HLP57738.1 S41 family peptidase [Candidatus Deferrimicrobium sp.]